VGGGIPPDYIITIITYNRVEWCQKKTLTMLKENNIPRELIYLIVHNKEQKEMYEAIPKDLYNEILVTNENKGIYGQMNWVMNHYKLGQKIVKLDDDISSILEVKGDKLVKTTNLKNIIKEGFSLCEKNGYKLWGLYPVPNAFYMKSPNEYSTDLKFIVGALMGIINEKIKIDLDIKIKGDYDYAIQSYKENGGIIRFNKLAFKYDIAKKLPERIKALEKDASIMVRKYPDYVRLNPSREGEILIKGIKGGKITKPIENRYEKGNTEILEDKIVMTPRVKSLQEQLLEVLKKTSMPKTRKGSFFGRKEHKQRGSVVGIGYSMNFGSGRRFIREPGEFASNKEHPELFKLIVEYGNEILPTGFEYTVITLNYNLKAKKHKDGGNAGVSCITFLGDYTGGGLYVYDKQDKPKLYDTHNKVIVFNGAELSHRTESFKGDRYALIYYSQKQSPKIPNVKMVGKGIEEEPVMVY